MSTAYDYLKEFANDKKCDDWTKLVIESYIVTRGKVTEELKNELVDCLIGKSNTISNVTSSMSSSNGDSTVVLKSIKHVSGVNALAENQFIKLNKDCNVIYGLNGTGKSSYFRILQAMLGNIEHKDLLPNVFSDVVEDVQVELQYSVQGNDKIERWDNSTKIEDISSIRVFDSSYTADFLRKRNSDELVLKPYHLEAFSNVVSLIDELKKLAHDKVDENIANLPIINYENMREETVELLYKDSFSDDDVKFFDESKDFDESDQAKLEKLLIDIDSLQKDNPEDKIAKLNAEISLCNKALSVIGNFEKQLHQIVKDGNDAAQLYKKYSDENRELKEKISIFEKIPGVGSDSWNAFIQKAEEYKEENKIDVCPYCHRPYDDDALKIVEAYTVFLKDKSTENLHYTERRINEIIKSFEKIKIPQLDDFSVDFTGFDDEDAKNVIQVASEAYEVVKQSLKNKDNVKIDIDFTGKLSKIKQYIEDAEEKIKSLNGTVEARTSSLISAKNEASKLEERKAINLQYTEILKYIEEKNRVYEINNIIDSKTTNKITAVAKTANQELLTVQLKNQFEKNLIVMGVTDKKIELSGTNSKGVQQTELTISSHKKVASILSEGEQKVAALALFLAEIFVADNKSTIILDDPVNSLDHRMMASFADVLLQLDNQILIFTHNKMFLDSIEVSSYGHVCKTITSDCNKNRGKHIYVYETLSEGKNRKGIIIEKSKDNARFFIDKSKDLLSESPFVESEKACTFIRKSVELVIDEVVFNNQVPTKFSRKDSRINWDALTHVSGDANMISDLKTIHNRVSGGKLHNGLENEENPVDKEELELFVEKLDNIIG